MLPLLSRHPRQSHSKYACYCVDLDSYLTSLQTGVSMDNPPLRQKFGGVLVTPLATYKTGDIAFAQFVAANPRVSGYLLYDSDCVDARRSQNNLRLEQTFLTVDRLQNNVWTPVRSDSHPSTTFEWLRTNSIAGYSTVNITW
jgi:neutral ceramidase